MTFLRDATLIDQLAASARALGQAQASIQWLQATVNQLQAERAVLLERVLGLHLPAPTIVRSPGAIPPTVATSAPVAAAAAAAEPFDLVAAFEDMGDEAAKQQGVGLTPDGFVTYAT